MQILVRGADKWARPHFPGPDPGARDQQSVRAGAPGTLKRRETTLSIHPTAKPNACSQIKKCKNSTFPPHFCPFEQVKLPIVMTFPKKHLDFLLEFGVLYIQHTGSFMPSL